MCVQCALRIDFLALLEEDAVPAHCARAAAPKVDLKSLSGTKDTILDCCRADPAKCITHRSAADSDSTNSTKLSQRFMCAFHDKEISCKHTSKNKFYCTDCNVKPE
jgi:hypothetical protein